MTPDYDAYRQRHKIEAVDAANGDTVCAHDGILVARSYPARWQHVPAALADARLAAGYSDGWPKAARAAR
jgi:hypothetical protein